MKTKFWIPVIALPLAFASCDKPTDYEKSKAESGAEKMAEGAKEIGAAAKEKIQEGATTAKEKSGPILEDMKEKSAAAIERTKEKSAEAGEAIKEAAKDAKDKIEEAVTPNPVPAAPPAGQ